jgi:hypothetical protein
LIQPSVAQNALVAIFCPQRPQGPHRPQRHLFNGKGKRNLLRARAGAQAGEFTLGGGLYFGHENLLWEFDTTKHGCYNKHNIGVNMLSKIPTFFAFTFFSFTTFFCCAADHGDVVIISTNDPFQAVYWQEFFNRSTPETLKTIVVYEDWPDGADNGLGSLYAFLKANEIAQQRLNINLNDTLASGNAVSLFHCAGMGKRLYPLTASEKNNKSAVKLPSKTGTQTVLELILKHTLQLTPYQKGRLSVFWGDQIFIPTTPQTTPVEHVNIYTMAGDFPSETEWKKRNLDQYGLIIVQDSKIKLVEKTTYPNLIAMVNSTDHRSDSPITVGVSLGSFSISARMLNELLVTFDNELKNKTGKLNTDYHFWMPLTWTKDAYLEFMATKGADTNDTVAVYDRMQNVKNHLISHDDTPIFGIQNMGEDALWTDFGSVKSYYKNLMGLLSGYNSSQNLLTELFGIDRTLHYDSVNNNILINCSIDVMEITNSVLINVQAKKIVSDASIIINSSVNELYCNRALAYQVNASETVKLFNGEVRSDVFFDRPPYHIAVYSNMEQDNKELWNTILPRNTYSFRELMEINESNITK